MNGHRTITRLAGKLTPDDNVEVAINTRIMPSLKAPKNRTEFSRVLKQNDPTFVGPFHLVKMGDIFLLFYLGQKLKFAAYSSPLATSTLLF